MRTFVILTTAFLFAAGSVRAAEVDDGWRNLQRVTRDRLYALILRDGGCVKGFLVSANDQTVVVGADPKDLSINRSDVLRISDVFYAPAHDAIFSGRSSWMDVKDADPKGSEYLHIVTKHGVERKWKQPKVTEDSISFEGEVLPKPDIRYVSYVRFKPLTRKEEYVHHENVDLLAPRFWFGAFALGKISVLIYDAKATEDNSPAECP